MNRLIIIFLIVTSLVYSQNMKYFDIQNNTVYSGASEPGVVWDSDVINVMNLPTQSTGPSDVNYNQLIAIRDITEAVDLWSDYTNYTIYYIR